MLRRWIVGLLTVLGLALGAAPVVEAGAAPGEARAEAGVAVAYKVYVRTPGTTSWSEAGTYASGPEASAAAEKLHRDGYEATVLSRVTATRLPPRPSTGKLPATDTVTPEQCAGVFRWVASMQDIAFKFPADGCYARAHLMIRRMQERGLKPAKVWSFENGEPLYVKTSHIPTGHVTWKYHVAPVLRVQLPDGRQRWYVIDPALFQGPATVAQWQAKQRRPGSPYEPYVTVARLGQAPVDAKGHRLPGTGYWPGPDPKEGLDVHAVKMMRLYKPYQDRMPPKVLVRSEQAEENWLLPRRRELLAA